MKQSASGIGALEGAGMKNSSSGSGYFGAAAPTRSFPPSPRSDGMPSPTRSFPPSPRADGMPPPTRSFPPSPRSDGMKKSSSGMGDGSGSGMKKSTSGTSGSFEGQAKLTLLASSAETAPKPSMGAGSGVEKRAANDYRGKRLREGPILLWHKKSFEKRYLVIWENKELVIYKTKPYNDRSTFLGIIKLTPAGTIFFMTAKDQPFCFQLQQETHTFRCAAPSADDREKWATVLMRTGLRLLLGPGQGESTNVQNLLQTLPALTRAAEMSAQTTVCVECETATAEVFCEQCEDPYCMKDFELQHKSGKRTTHTTRPIEGGGSAETASIVELYTAPFPFLLADLLENIPTAPEVDTMMAAANRGSRGSTALAVAGPQDWTRQSDFVDSISHEELLKKAVQRSENRKSPRGKLMLFDDSDEDEGETKDDHKSLKAQEDALTQLVAQFRSCCEVKDRSYHLRHYPKCFVGKDCVDTLVKKGIVFTRTEAVRLGNKLMDQGVFHHVSKEHCFEDEAMFYQFRADLATVVIPT